MNSQKGDGERKEKRKRGAKIQKISSGSWHFGAKSQAEPFPKLTGKKGKTKQNKTVSTVCDLLRAGHKKSREGSPYQG